MVEIAGKIAVITGASAGIGAAIARELAQAGVRLLLTARREDRLQALASELAAETGSEVAFLAADIAAVETPERLLRAARERFGTVDILVNNAGILRVGSLEEFDLDQLGQLIAVNFEACVRASYVFARAMKTTGSGAIINLSSIGAHVNAAGMGVYGGLKRAVEGFTDSLRIELAGSGIRVGLVAPGTTSTEIFDDMKGRGERGWDQYITPLEPVDLARAVRFMLEQPGRANIPRLHVYANEDRF